MYWNVNVYIWPTYCRYQCQPLTSDVNVDFWRPCVNVDLWHQVEMLIGDLFKCKCQFCQFLRYDSWPLIYSWDVNVFFRLVYLKCKCWPPPYWNAQFNLDVWPTEMWMLTLNITQHQTQLRMAQDMLNIFRQTFMWLDQSMDNIWNQIWYYVRSILWNPSFYNGEGHRICRKCPFFH